MEDKKIKLEDFVAHLTKSYQDFETWAKKQIPNMEMTEEEWYDQYIYYVESDKVDE